MASKHDPLEHEALNGASLRRKAGLMASIDIDGAYAIAISIVHPWYRCQSLSQVAEHAESTLRDKALRESFESAMACHDENRRVSVACWPIRVALNQGELGLATRFLAGCVYQLNLDEDPISRWCATGVLNTIKKNNNLRHSFFDAFRHATREGHGWKVERAIKYLANDGDVQMDQRYIDYLHYRKAGIDEWKMANSERKSR